MSAESRPITPAAFAEALKALPLSAVYAKVSELRNSIAHLTRSNEELRTYIRESEGGPEAADNKEIEGYIQENEGVIDAMTERITLCKAEIEERGERWIEEGGEPIADGVLERGGDGTSPVINGTTREHEHDASVGETAAAAQHSGVVNGVGVHDSAAPIAPTNAPDRQEEHDMEEEGVYL
ncbi:hypothetical protein VTN77DRAFT_3058 [Rasamsonia byssochlamydoides]|uniref:uncharacterized protein n=1 Tax=Rasamsonia byssochlamydoides TaxID=89139 RepID=UPI003743FF55